MEKLDLVPIGSALIDEQELRRFNCGNQNINDFLVYQARQFDIDNRAATFLLLKKRELLGFYTLVVGELEVKNIEEQCLIQRPYVNLAYFAIDEKYHHKGYGKVMMGEVFQSVAVISFYAGVEIIYLEAIDDSVRFYESLGFKLFKPMRRPEMMQCDTSKLEFPMFITIKTLYQNNYYGYPQNYVRDTIEKQT